MAAPTAPVSGQSATIYRLTTGTRATWNASTVNGRHSGAAPGSLAIINNVRGDVEIPDEDNDVDVSIRNGIDKCHEQGLTDCPIKIPMVYDPNDNLGDGGFKALLLAYMLGHVIALAFLDGPKATAGVRGIWADWEVHSIEKTEAIDGMQMCEVTVKMALTAVLPEFVVVA